MSTQVHSTNSRRRAQRPIRQTAATTTPTSYLTTHLAESRPQQIGLLDSSLIFSIVDGDLSSFLLALREVVKAIGFSAVAEAAGVSRENLYRTLSAKGNPELSTILAVLSAIGLRFSIRALTEADCAYARAGQEETAK